MGIAYSNKFLLHIGKRVAAKFYSQRFRFVAPCIKKQDEYGISFEVWDYPEAFTEFIKHIIIEEIKN